jgi:hypothetical protein
LKKRGLKPRKIKKTKGWILYKNTKIKYNRWRHIFYRRNNYKIRWVYKWLY